MNKDVIEVKNSGSSVWMRRSEYDALKRMTEDFNKKMVFGVYPADNRSDEEKYIANCKWCFVFLEGQNRSQMVWVNNQDMKAYKADGYSIHLPLQEIKYKSIDRWARSMDL